MIHIIFQNNHHSTLLKKTYKISSKRPNHNNYYNLDSSNKKIIRLLNLINFKQNSSLVILNNQPQILILTTIRYN